MTKQILHASEVSNNLVITQNPSFRRVYPMSCNSWKIKILFPRFNPISIDSCMDLFDCSGWSLVINDQSRKVFDRIPVESRVSIKLIGHETFNSLAFCLVLQDIQSSQQSIHRCQYLPVPRFFGSHLSKVLETQPADMDDGELSVVKSRTLTMLGRFHSIEPMWITCLEAC